MRTLALLLLLMNIGFFAWQQQLLPWLPWQPELLQPEPAPSYRATLPQLVLLSEREAAQSPHATPPVPHVEQAKNEQVVKVEIAAPVETSHSVVTPATESAPVSPVVTETKSQPQSEPNVSVHVENVEKTVVSESVTPPQAQSEPISFQKLAMRLISQGQVNLPPPQPAQTSPVPAATPPAQPTEIAANAVQTHTQSDIPQKIASSQTKSVMTSDEPQTTKSAPVSPVTVADAEEKNKTPVPQKIASSQTEPATASDEPQTTKSAPVSPVTVADAEEKNKTLPVPPTKTNKTEVICYQVGHFSQLGEAQTANDWFKKKQVTATAQKSDTRLATTTWLYLPAARSLQSAHTTQQRLKQLGIADTVVINNPNGYIVSLGVYRDKVSVSKRLRELHNKGFDNVQSEERYATETKYWLNVKIVANPTALLSQFQKAFKGLQTKTIACDDLR